LRKGEGEEGRGLLFPADRGGCYCTISSIGKNTEGKKEEGVLYIFHNRALFPGCHGKKKEKEKRGGGEQRSISSNATAQGLGKKRGGAAVWGLGQIGEIPSSGKKRKGKRSSLCQSGCRKEGGRVPKGPCSSRPEAGTKEVGEKEFFSFWSSATGKGAQPRPSSGGRKNEEKMRPAVLLFASDDKQGFFLPADQGRKTRGKKKEGKKVG